MHACKALATFLPARRVGPPGVRVEEHRGPAVIEEHRRPGVVIEETEGRRRGDCVTHSESTTRNGVTVTENSEECSETAEGVARESEGGSRLKNGTAPAE
jgi:hypothetical protein